MIAIKSPTYVRLFGLKKDKTYSWEENDEGAAIAIGVNAIAGRNDGDISSALDEQQNRRGEQQLYRADCLHNRIHDCRRFVDTRNDSVAGS